MNFSIVDSVVSHIVNFFGFFLLGTEISIYDHTYSLTIFGLPIIVAWLIFAAIFFTFKLGFVNIRLFSHCFAVLAGKYHDPSKPGEVSQFQACTSALSATIGIGAIGGVAVAVAIGGPGAAVWIVIAGFFGMSLKFAEVTLAMKYRHIGEDGKVYGGAFYYLRDGLASIGRPKIGKALSVIFAFCCLCGVIGGSAMFQNNQATSILSSTFFTSYNQDTTRFIISLLVVLAIFTIIVGSIKRISKVAEFLVPLKVMTYIISCLAIIIYHHANLGNALQIMFKSAFDFKAFIGGSLGVVIWGVRRAAFANEAGIGTAPIAHSAAQTDEPVRQGAVGLIEPFLDTVIICFLTGLVIVISGVYTDKSFGAGGVLMTSAAFATFHPAMSYILAVIVALFGFSTIMTGSYYGEQAWSYLFGKNKIRLWQVIYVILTFVGGIISLRTVIDLADILFLSMSIPNIIGLYFMRNVVRDKTKRYIARLKNGEFKSLNNELIS